MLILPGKRLACRQPLLFPFGLILPESYRDPVRDRRHFSRAQPRAAGRENVPAGRAGRSRRRAVRPAWQCDIARSVFSRAL